MAAGRAPYILLPPGHATHMHATCHSTLSSPSYCAAACAQVPTRGSTPANGKAHAHSEELRGPGEPHGQSLNRLIRHVNKRKVSYQAIEGKMFCHIRRLGISLVVSIALVVPSFAQNATPAPKSPASSSKTSATPTTKSDAKPDATTDAGAISAYPIGVAELMTSMNSAVTASQTAVDLGRAAARLKQFALHRPP